MQIYSYKENTTAGTTAITRVATADNNMEHCKQ
jgi:hypothetical protein